MRWLYPVVWTVLLPLLMLRLLWRSRRLPAYRQGWVWRLGGFPRLQPGSILVHTVSVGEFLAALPLLRRLLQDGERVLLTTTTPTARALVERHLSDFLASRQLVWGYLPWDHPWLLARFWCRTQPRLLLLFETELWPSLLAKAQRSRCPVLLFNARLSERSLLGYQRFARSFLPLIQQLTLIACQSLPDKQRFVRLGVPEAQVQVLGNMKLDFCISADEQALAQQWRQALTRPWCWLAASTHDPEEAQLLGVQQRLLADGVVSTLLLAPRHPERAAAILAQAERLQLRVGRRSLNQFADVDVLLLDSIGELRSLYGAAQAVFIGGSWLDKGGQSPIEACAWGLPLLMGRSRHNFSSLCAELAAAGALRMVEDPDALLLALHQLIAQPLLAGAQGQAGRDYLQANSGSLDRYYHCLQAYLLAES